MNFDNRILKLKSKTWDRDSYGLFDFETNKYYARDIDIRGPGLIYRDGREIHFMSQATAASFKPISNSTVEPLATVTVENGAINLKSQCDQSTVDINKHLWQIIREGEYDSAGYLLKCNDIIKLGRVIFKIKQIKIIDENDEQSNLNYKKSILDSIKQHFDNLNQADPKLANKLMTETEARASVTAACRICLSDNNDPEDPFISPCLCTGSMLHIHLLCLQRWMKTRLDIQENKNIITVYWKSLDCELCKTPFPIIIRQGGKEYNLIPLETKNTGSYIVMDSLSKDRKPIGIHIIDISGTNKIVLGRGHDCDLKVNDISVSRMHAVIKINKGKIFIQDNNSKFGTLVLKKNDTVFDESLSNVSLQNGRTILKFSIKRPWFTYVPCIGTRITNASTSSLNFKSNKMKTMTEDEFDLQDEKIPTDRIDTAPKDRK